MIIGSVICYIIGAISLFYGISLNNDMSSRKSSFLSSGTTDPGTTYIIIGVIALIIATILLIVGIMKKHNKNNSIIK